MPGAEHVSLLVRGYVDFPATSMRQVIHIVFQFRAAQPAGVRNLPFPPRPRVNAP